MTLREDIEMALDFGAKTRDIKETTDILLQIFDARTKASQTKADKRVAPISRNSMSLQELLARVVAATGPSVELDGEFAKLNRTMPKGAKFITENIWGQKGDQWYDGGYGDYVFYSPERVTESVDEVLRYFEEMLPGHMLDVTKGRDGHGEAVVNVPGNYRVLAPTVCLAVLIALLKALILQESA